MSYVGDYAAGDTVIIPWSSQDGSGAAITATLAASSVEIYKDGGTTQRASDAGVTSAIDFDSKTGAHVVSIDTSDDTDSGFYSAGSTYHVLLEAAVDGKTVRVWRTFSISRTAQIADAVWDEVIEASLTARQLFRRINGVLLGATSGLIRGVGPFVGKSLSGLIDRVSVTIDADGNRGTPTFDDTDA